MSRYYIRTPNGKISFDTIVEAARAAQKAADKWGISIGVFGNDGFKERTKAPKGKTYKRNPAGKRKPKWVTYATYNGKHQWITAHGTKKAGLEQVERMKKMKGVYSNVELRRE